MKRTDVLQIKLTTDGAGKVKAELGGVERALGGVDNKAGGAFSALGKFKGVIGVLGLAALGGEIISTSRKFGVLNASLVTATGSQEKATAAFADLKQFAATTPFQLDQITEAYIRLTNLGLDPSQAALTSYGNTAAAMGRDIMQFIEAVADAATGEFERLKEFGIKARSEGEQVAFTFRGATTTVAKDAASIEAYLRKLGDTEFAGGMERQSQTLDGALSNLGDSWDNLMSALGDAGASEATASAARGLADIANAAAEATREAGYFAGALAALNETVAQFSGVAGPAFTQEETARAQLRESLREMEQQYASLQQTVEQQMAAAPQNAEMIRGIWTPSMQALADRIAAAKKELGLLTGEASKNTAAINGNGAAVRQLEDDWDAVLDIYIEEEKQNKERWARRKAGYTEESAAIGAWSASLQQLIDTLDPFDRQAREMFAAIELLDRAFAAGQLSPERYNELMQQVIATMGDATAATEQMAAAADPYAEAWTHAIERMDAGWSGMWQDFLETGKMNMDSIKDAFTRMLAEMIHAATTRKIMISLGVGGPGTAMAGETGSGAGLESLLSGNSSLLGVAGLGSALGYGGMAYMLGDMLGLGKSASAGAGLGAGVGTLMAAGTMFAGPLGAVLGGVVGTILGGLLGKKKKPPKGALAGGSAAADVGDIEAAYGAFGAIGFDDGARRVTGKKKSAAAEEFFRALAAIDNEFARFLDDDEVARIRAALDGWTSSSERAFSDFDEMAQERFAVIFGEVDASLAALMTHAQGLDLEGVINYATSLMAINAYIDTSPLEAYQKAQEASLQTYGGLVSAYDSQVSAVQSLIDNLDDSYSSATALSEALAGLGTTELQMVAYTQQAMQQIDGLVASAVERIRMDMMNQEEQYQYLTGQAEALAATLATLTDPTAITQTMQQIEQLTTQAWQMLMSSGAAQADPTLAVDYIAFLEGAQTQADAAIQAAQDSAASQHDALAGAAQQQLAAAAEQAQAAAAQREAAAALHAAAVAILEGNLNGSQGGAAAETLAANTSILAQQQQAAADMSNSVAGMQNVVGALGSALLAIPRTISVRLEGSEVGL